MHTSPRLEANQLYLPSRNDVSLSNNDVQLTTTQPEEAVPDTPISTFLHVLSTLSLPLTSLTLNMLTSANSPLTSPLPFLMQMSYGAISQMGVSLVYWAYGNVFQKPAFYEYLYGREGGTGGLVAGGGSTGSRAAKSTVGHLEKTSQ